MTVLGSGIDDKLPSIYRHIVSRVLYKWKGSKITIDVVVILRGRGERQGDRIKAGQANPSGDPDRGWD